MPKIAILTSGGDAPGMNMAAWAATSAAYERGWEVLGVREGFSGLLRGDFLALSPAHVLPHARLGGTFLGTAREPDFASKIPQALDQLRHAAVSHLLVLGGNGSLAGAARLAEAGLAVAGIPCTIDNDVDGSDEAIGFDSALNTALPLFDGMRDTAEALPRWFSLETLGGDTGFLARAVARAGGADLLLVPESLMSFEQIEQRMKETLERQRFAIVVASEGYPGLMETLERLEQALGLRLRHTRIGHAQRGGRPSGRDRLLARSMAENAVETLAHGGSGMIGLRQGQYRLVPFSQMAPRKPLSEEQP
jgi:6-phosphofructokinase 1